MTRDYQKPIQVSPTSHDSIKDEAARLGMKIKAYIEMLHQQHLKKTKKST